MNTRLAPIRWIPIFVFLFLLLMGASVGLSDDEAYYWVLSQRPSLGYAFHPPMIAWAIAFFDFLTPGKSEPWSVRLVSCFCSAGIAALVLDWVKTQSGFVSKNAIGVFLSFFGFMGIAWMAVPDLPLFLGWSLTFWGASRRIAEPGSKIAGVAVLTGIAIGTLSKFSGVAFAFSSVAACELLGRFTPRERIRNLLWVAGGLLLGLLPTLLWNSEHNWGAIKYQFSERQHGTFSLLRWIRFIFSQILIASPALFWAAIQLIKGHKNKLERYVLIWVFPTLIYWVQPVWADFKPHWALATWFPVLAGWMALLSQEAATSIIRWVRFHILWGSLLFLGFFSAIHFPWISHLGAEFRKDFTNDFYGWDQLVKELGEHPDAKGASLWVGSRYQIASQLAFAARDANRVTLIPRSSKEETDWGAASEVSNTGPNWPQVLKTVLFVADQRYSQGPGFEKSRCTPLEVNPYRRAYGIGIAKEFKVWKCESLLPDRQSVQIPPR